MIDSLYLHLKSDNLFEKIIAQEYIAHAARAALKIML